MYFLSVIWYLGRKVSCLLKHLKVIILEQILFDSLFFFNRQRGSRDFLQRRDLFKFHKIFTATVNLVICILNVGWFHCLKSGFSTLDVLYLPSLLQGATFQSFLFFHPGCHIPEQRLFPETRGSRSTIVQSPYHSRGVRCTIGNTQKWNTSKIPRNLNFTLKKRVYRDIFEKTIKMKDVLFIYFEWIVKLLLKYKASPFVL